MVLRLRGLQIRTWSPRRRTSCFCRSDLSRPVSKIRDDSCVRMLTAAQTAGRTYRKLVLLPLGSARRIEPFNTEVVPIFLTAQRLRRPVEGGQGRAILKYDSLRIGRHSLRTAGGMRGHTND